MTQVYKDAVISACEHYRYSLSRRWGEDGPLMLFVGVNPSTANHQVEDATTRKWEHFARREGCAGYIAVNAFAFRATKVKVLASVSDPVGVWNGDAIGDAIRASHILVPCWGAREKLPPMLRPQLDALMKKIVVDAAALDRPVKVFGYTASGDPKHVLLLAHNTPLIPHKMNPGAQDNR